MKFWVGLLGVSSVFAVCGSICAGAFSCLRWIGLVVLFSGLREWACVVLFNCLRKWACRSVVWFFRLAPHGWCHVLRCLGVKVKLLISFGMEFCFCRFSANSLRSLMRCWFVGGVIAVLM